jgi:subfamily B ATP-binding cassette protein MsbA
VATNDFDLIKRVFLQSRPYRWMTVVMLASTTVTSVLTGYLFSKLAPFLSLIGQVIKGQGPGPTPDIVAASKDLTQLGVTLLLLSPLAAVSAYLSWWAGQWVANRTMRDVRNRVLSHLVRLELAFHHQLTRGDLLTRLTSDLGSVLMIQQQLYGKLLQRPIEAIGLIGFATWYAWHQDGSWWMGPVLVTGMAAVVVALIPVLRKTRRRSKVARESLAANFGVLEQITAGIRVIKAMGSTEREALRYAEANLQLFNANMRLARTRAQSDAVTNATIFLIVGGTFVALGVLFAHHLVNPGVAFLGLGVFARLITSVREVMRTWGDVQEQLPAAERVNALLDRPSAVQDRPGAVPCPTPRAELRCEGVAFRYQPTAEDVLHDLDLVIPVGKTVALVGKSGAGKTTLMDLLPRFHDVTGGRITIDGTDLRDFSLDSLAQHFAIVQQDNFLFDDTVYANIAYGRPAATRAEVEQAAQRAHVHDAILALEGGQGYATPVGDRGTRLSGGQRQRIAIARAFLRDAPVLLLDEPTSALDAESEHHVQAALIELMRGRTVVVIAHRLATIQHADVIYVLAGSGDPGHGAVLEHGTHSELLAAGGVYAELVRKQTLKG